MEAMMVVEGEGNGEVEGKVEDGEKIQRRKMKRTSG